MRQRPVSPNLLICFLQTSLYHRDPVKSDFR